MPKIYYSVGNGGDGSAYPIFFHSSEAADLHQEMQEGWGEPCTGYLEYEGDAVFEDVQTDAEYAQELKTEMESPWFTDEHIDEDILQVMKEFIAKHLG